MAAERMSRAWTRLKALFSEKGNRLPRLDEREVLESYRERDPEENRETSLPADETVALHCAWAVEFYTPAHMDNLAKNLLRFNQTSAVQKYDTEHLDAWVKELHRASNGGGWINLGLMERKGERPKFIGATRRVDLPPSVEYALAHAFRVSPSIVCIAVCFVFDEDVSSSLDNALRRYRDSYVEPIDAGFSIFTPEVQKLEDLGSMRSRISVQSTEWFKENFPGLFSSGLLGGHVPVCEFITLQKARPFPKGEVDGSQTPLYLRLLGLSTDWDAWRSGDIPGLLFSTQMHHRGSPVRYSTLSANGHDFPDHVNNYGGHEGQLARIYYLNSAMPNLVCMWAALALLDVFTENINKIRNSDEFRTGESDDPVKNLQRLRDHISSMTDVGAVLADFCKDSQSRLWTFGHIAAFTPCMPHMYEDNATLGEVLKRSISERAVWLHDTDLYVRDQLTQMGTIINASENVRLQRTVAILTWVVVLLTLVAVALATVQLLNANWGNAVKDLGDATASLWKMLWP